jgi:glutamate/tyrosine decarboxylase-like PLP-dependent enzyme
MLKDPSIPALLGYFAVMLTNPNNHAYEGGPVTTEMEMEVVDDLLKLVGFKNGWGHLTSGGSLANLEALWAVRDFRKEGIAVFSKGSHYSWKRICAILKVDFIEIDVDENYRIDLNQLEDVLKNNTVMFVMANFGTTGVGAVDPINEILKT